MISATTCCGSFVAVSFSSMTQIVVVRLRWTGRQSRVVTSEGDDVIDRAS